MSNNKVDKNFDLKKWINFNLILVLHVKECVIRNYRKELNGDLTLLIIDDGTSERKDEINYMTDGCLARDIPFIDRNFGNLDFNITFDAIFVNSNL